MDNPFPYQGDAQTGGNTRLLFAEQDDNRTRKGKQTDGTGTAASLTPADPYKGVAANIGALSSPEDNDTYFNSGDSRFYLITDASETEATVIGPGGTIVNGSDTYTVLYSGVDSGVFADAAAGTAAAIMDGDGKYVFVVGTTTNSIEITGTTSGAGDIFYVQPRVVSADIAETSENIPIEFLKSSLSANKAQAGPQTYGNGFSIALSEHGSHLFFRTLANSRSTDIHVDTRNATKVPANANAGRRDTLPAVVTNRAAVAPTLSGVALSTDIESVSGVQLQVTAAGLAADAVVTIEIAGYDHSGTAIEESMQLTGPSSKTTDFYFAKPPSGGATTIKAVGTIPSSTTIAVSSQDKWTQVTFEQQDSVLLPGWTLEVRKGTIPITYTGVLPAEASVSLARDTSLQMDMTVIAFDSLPYTAMDGQTVERDNSEGIDINNQMGQGGLAFTDASETLFTGWQCYLEVTEPGAFTPLRVPLTDATFSINLQLEQADLIVGDRRPGPAFRSTLRDVMLDGSILFTRDRDWVTLFRNNTDFKNPKLIMRNAPIGGFPYELQIEFGIGQLMSSTDPQVSDLGLITQAFNMKFRESSSGASDDFKFIMITDNWQFDQVGGLRLDGPYAG